ncbi:stage II sporulation protein D [Natranaerobius trueperi]|uniref:Stage II sporulation protein D n=1 Tax=Natranaerobius trueperi TaxID=759412 RepID=A0A226C2J3_9FIRM|nr:stage II sporulation protein D [Natranaerobius trueperi]OWZ84610.1 stage II sporulation protein D [Natranaerobius trueperi]
MDRRLLYEFKSILKVSGMVGTSIIIIAGIIGGVSFYLLAPSEVEESTPPEELFPIKTEEDLTVRVYFHEKDQVKEKNLEDYLVGVVISEVPPNFNKEAIKAQAVVARSYTYSRLEKRGGPGCNNHENADICTNPDHCQAHYSESEVNSIYGDKSEKYYNIVSNAVSETMGEIVTYNRKPIPEAPYHSTCGGTTETAGEVWQTDMPYLENVECNYCNHSSHFESETTIPFEEIEQVMSREGVQVPVLADNPPDLTVTERSKIGRVKTVNLMGNEFSGRQIRQMFDLRSTDFDWETSGDSVSVTTRGFGHGVGLCQYGADGMGKAGYNYRDIIRQYFTEIEFGQISK